MESTLDSFKEFKMSTKMEYVVVTRNTVGDFQEKITEMINEGWQLVGGPFMSLDENNLEAQMFSQALIKQLSRREQIEREGKNPDNMEFEV